MFGPTPYKIPRERTFYKKGLLMYISKQLSKTPSLFPKCFPKSAIRAGRSPLDCAHGSRNQGLCVDNEGTDTCVFGKAGLDAVLLENSQHVSCLPRASLAARSHGGWCLQSHGNSSLGPGTWPRHAAYGILVPDPVRPAVEAWSLNHWTAREVPWNLDF